MTSSDESIRELQQKVNELKADLANIRSIRRRSLVLICFCGVSLLFVAAQGARQQGLTSNRFEVRDAQGNLRGLFGIENDAVVFGLLDKEGKPTVNLGVLKDSKVIMTFGARNNPHLEISSTPKDSSLTLQSPVGRYVSLSQAADGHSDISFASDDAKLPASFSVHTDTDGDGYLYLENAKARIGMSNFAKLTTDFFINRDETRVRAGLLDAEGFSLDAATKDATPFRLRLPLNKAKP